MTMHAPILANVLTTFRGERARYSAARASAASVYERIETFNSLMAARPSGIADIREKIHVALTEGRHGPEILRQIYLDLYETPSETELLDELAYAQQTIEEEVATLTEIGSDDPNLAPVIAARTEQAGRIEQLLLRGTAMKI